MSGYVNFESLFDVFVEWIKDECIALTDLFTDTDDLKDRIKDEFDADDLYDCDELAYTLSKLMEPGDVFDADRLHAWAKDQDPYDIFGDTLDEWALANGFVREEE